MLVAVADIAPWQALLVLVDVLLVVELDERLIFIPAILAPAPAAEAGGRSFWK
jgi:hypothetical protein